MKETVIVLKDILHQGLAQNNNQRNNPALVQSDGAFVYEGALQAVEQFTGMTLPASPTTAFAFPYPQLFVLSDVIILCNVDQIWELTGTTGSDDNGWTSKITSLTHGTPWTVVDSKNYIALSNMQVAVSKNPQTGGYAIDSTIPTGSYGNYNGQF